VMGSETGETKRDGKEKVWLGFARSIEYVYWVKREKKRINMRGGDGKYQGKGSWYQSPSALRLFKEKQGPSYQTLKGRKPVDHSLGKKRN